MDWWGEGGRGGLESEQAPTPCKAPPQSHCFGLLNLSFWPMSLSISNFIIPNRVVCNGISRISQNCCNTPPPKKKDAGQNRLQACSENGSMGDMGRLTMRFENLHAEFVPMLSLPSLV